ncbi:radical SAM/SPASM family putative metalloenzyme maturase [Pseudodesulfovibrio sp. zrk46]|uniref:radical SAM/SPASM family putative metalloenzyme maturase n=1 Tax=Pseudodesulfovibrio sp. zrk46 TaxID=2725288 RepID=UPI00144A2495|nr:radical SAM/SPASM family putative metalloenzyme maturase [Pseudodesulfovibrio sp. zrk46]QJB56911.1 radical SAM/SPASM family putative metalloenzyme maturase [Pseudodesulfovibrio sp. zrk46]
MTEQRPYPSKLYVETTTRCNLRCSMCVKQAEGACIPEGDMPMEVFHALKPAFPHLDGLILNGIGEPLLTKDLVDMVAVARKSMPREATISFQTNGLLMTKRKAMELVHAGLDTICLSVDMVGDDGVFHGDEEVDRIVHAFAHLREAAKSVGRKLRIGVEFVLMRDTAESLPHSIEWAADQGASFVLVTHMLPYGEASADQELFNPNTEQSMAEFARWQTEAEELGLDIAGYFGKAWKINRSAEDERVVRFITERKRDALARNIPIHTSSLLKWSTPEKLAEQQWLASILEQAQAVADACGMEVTLPPVTATHERHCDFVEKGVAHITTDGDVRPCYFLWHEYSCFMDGGAKQVTPKTFGNVLQNDILDIWQSAPYAAFRHDVLDYAYPYCSNCSVVPCSDVTGIMGEFEHDCHGTSVPCGHCVWCMGGVRCLV